MKKILILLLSLLLVFSLFACGNNKESDNGNEDPINNEEPNNNDEPNNNTETGTGLYALDYDYASLVEGGTGAQMGFGTVDVRVEYAYVEDMPENYFEDYRYDYNELNSASFEEVNSRYYLPFYDDASTHFIVFDISGSGNVKTEFDKGNYAIYDLSIINFTDDCDFYDDKAVFDVIVKGFGRPYAVIKAVDDKANYTSNDVYVIYKKSNGFVVFQVYDTFSKTDNEEKFQEGDYSWFVPTETMLQELINQNFGSNGLSRYEISYVYNNGSSLIENMHKYA